MSGAFGAFNPTHPNVKDIETGFQTTTTVIADIEKGGTVETEEPRPKTWLERSYFFVALRKFNNKIRQADYLLTFGFLYYTTLIALYLASFVVFFVLYGVGVEIDNYFTPVSIAGIVLYGTFVLLLLIQRTSCFRFITGNGGGNYPYNAEYIYSVVFFGISALFTFVSLMVNYGIHNGVALSEKEILHHAMQVRSSILITLLLGIGNYLIWIAFILFPKYTYIYDAQKTDAMNAIFQKKKSIKGGFFAHFIEDKLLYNNANWTFLHYHMSLFYVALCYQIFCDVTFSFTYNTRSVYTTLMVLYGVMSLCSYAMFVLIIVYFYFNDKMDYIMMRILGDPAMWLSYILYFVFSSGAKLAIYFMNYHHLSPSELPWSESVKFYYLAISSFCSLIVCGLLFLFLICLLVYYCFKNFVPSMKKHHKNIKETLKEAKQEANSETRQSYQESIDQDG